MLNTCNTVVVVVVVVAAVAAAARAAHWNRCVSKKLGDLSRFDSPTAYWLKRGTSPCNPGWVPECPTGYIGWDILLNVCNEVRVPPGFDRDAWACTGALGCQSWGDTAGSSASLGSANHTEYIDTAYGVKVVSQGGTEGRNWELMLACPAAGFPSTDGPMLFTEATAQKRYTFLWSDERFCAPAPPSPCSTPKFPDLRKFDRPQGYVIPKGSPCDADLVPECATGELPWDVAINVCESFVPNFGDGDISECREGALGCQSWGDTPGSSAMLGTAAHAKYFDSVNGTHVESRGGTDGRKMTLLLACPKPGEVATEAPVMWYERAAEKLYGFRWLHEQFC